MSVEEAAAWTWDTLEYRLAREQLDVSSDGGREVHNARPSSVAVSVG